MSVFWSFGFMPEDLCIQGCQCVCVSHHIWKTAHQIFLKLCTKLYIDESKKCSKRIFEKKFLISRLQGISVKNGPKIDIFCRIIKTIHQNLMKFGQKLQNMVCHHMSQGCMPGKLFIIHLIPWRTIGLKKLKIFELRYEQKLYLIQLCESNGMKIDHCM